MHHLGNWIRTATDTLRRTWRRWLMGTLLFTSSPAWATYTCIGTIDGVALNPSGTVTVSSVTSGLPMFYVCQIGNTLNGVGPEQCKAI